jgi:hypothetical protein
VIATVVLGFDLSAKDAQMLSFDIAAGKSNPEFGDGADLTQIQPGLRDQALHGAQSTGKAMQPDLPLQSAFECLVRPPNGLRFPALGVQRHVANHSRAKLHHAPEFIKYSL